MSAALVIEDLSIRFGRHVLFENVSLTLRQGEFVTIMGDNGVGKTSLTDAIFANLKPTKGRISFWGKHLSHHSHEILARTARVITEPEIVGPFVTIKSFLTHWAKTRPQWSEPLASRLVSDFGLDIAKQLSHLSSGEQAKVKLVKALAARPELLILDELTANLSPSSKDVVLKVLLELFSENKMAVLYISHAHDEATRLSDRIVELTSKGLLEVLSNEK